MSDLEKINPEDDMNLLDIATHQPKYVDEKTRSFKGLTQDEWYEIVQWLQLRMDDASKWTMTKIDVMYSDLKGYFLWSARFGRAAPRFIFKSPRFYGKILTVACGEWAIFYQGFQILRLNTLLQKSPFAKL